MKKNRLIVLSDIHIGSNHKTNWYQRSVHEPVLLTILDYVRSKSDTIDELIISGDLFDQWTYPADTEPPSFSEIVKANPNIFGDIISGGTNPGAIPETLSALDGKITYINGNHDMSVTAEDIKLLTKGDFHINAVDELIYEPALGRGKIVCTHGHVFSLFNAPDSANPPDEWGSIPLGYFMARLASQWTADKLDRDYPPGSTTADMPDGGTPSGACFGIKALTGCIKEALSGKDHLAELVMGAQLEAADYGKNRHIKLPGGKKVKASKVAGVYKKLMHTFPSAPGIDPELYGLTPALFALTGSDIANSLDHFAKELAEKYRLVLMGHTHVMEDEDEHFIFHKKSLYANSGFCCPSQPDMGENGAKPEKIRYPSFIEAVLDAEKSQLTVGIKAVVKNGDKYAVIRYPGLKKARIDW